MLFDSCLLSSFSDSSECCVVVTCSHHATDEEGSPCQGTLCGPHAECKHAVLQEEAETGAAETICVCEDGYTGDPDSAAGCSLAAPPSASPVSSSCLVNSTSYRPGQDWYDGCQYKCTCSHKLEILCQPRCKLIAENVDAR